MIPPSLHRHITVEEINSLSEDEVDMLLYICNVWAPIKPPMPTEDNAYPVTLNIIRSTIKEAVIDRVTQANSVISDEGKEVYNSLKTKLGIINP